MKALAAVMLLLANLVLSGCAGTVSDDTLWQIDVAAPNHYEVWVTNMRLEKPGIRSWRIPVGTVGCCWKGDFGPRGKGGNASPFPTLITLHWFSFAEQKYYATLIEIPSDLHERMGEPVRHITQRGNIRFKPRSTLVLGLAPGGEVVVWMMSQRTNAVEVMRVPAVEVEGDPADFSVLTEAYLEKHGAYLKEHGIPLEGW